MIYWFTGQPGAGKTTLALKLVEHLRRCGAAVVHLDGDDFRQVTENQDYSRQGRFRNVRLAMRMAQRIEDAGVLVVCSFVSPFAGQRDLIKSNGAKEIYVHTTNRRGREDRFAPDYEVPTANFIDIDTTDRGIDETFEELLGLLPEPAGAFSI